MKWTAWAFALAAVVILPHPAAAQFGGPPPDQPNMYVSAAMRAATVESLATAIERKYVFPDVAKKTATELRARLKKGAYNGLDSAFAFCDSLSGDLRAIGKDRHFRVGYWNRDLPESVFLDSSPSNEERARADVQARRLNYGFEKVQRLAGNVGYLELRAFDGSPDGGRLAMAAMTLLDGSDALIVDLRRNGGGDPNLIMLILSWLFPADDRVHVNDFYLREGNTTEQYFTSTSVPAMRYLNKEVYVLTSRRTGSAAEEFAYDLKNLKRGTLVGETTVGAANPGHPVRLNSHFAAFISHGRAVNPITKTNWEGVGVEPDVKTSADDALKTAHVSALNHLMAIEQDPDRKPSLERALQQAKDAPVEALDLGGPRKPAGGK
ncbi:MAG: S41 family peptidase [Candidatus Eiseniibacteriota bacterium]